MTRVTSEATIDQCLVHCNDDDAMEVIRLETEFVALSKNRSTGQLLHQPTDTSSFTDCCTTATSSLLCNVNVTLEKLKDEET